jgi:hypothetical protein
MHPWLLQATHTSQKKKGAKAKKKDSHIIFKYNIYES